MNISSTNRISAPIILDDLQNIQSAVFRGAVVDGCYQGRVRECLYVIWLNWPFNASLTTRRCLVGDPSGKSYGDVAFLEQHNLQSNILSDKFKMKFWHEHTLIQTQCVYCVTLCLLSLVCQVWVPLVGQTGGRRQTLSWCVVTAVGPRCLSGRAATSESSRRTPLWHGQFSRHECMTSSWSLRSAYVKSSCIHIARNQI